MTFEIFENKKKLHVFNWLFKVLDLKLKWEKKEKKLEKIHVKLHVFNWLFKVLDLKLKWERNERKKGKNFM
jgi:uncharacterized membrane protein